MMRWVAVLLLVLALVVMGFAALADSVEGAVQAAASMEAMRAAREAQRAAVGMSLLTVALGILAGAGLLLALILWVRLATVKKQAAATPEGGRWVGGPNANWGRVGNVYSPRQVDGPRTSVADVVLLALAERMGMLEEPKPGAGRRLIEAGQANREPFREDEAVEGWWDDQL